MPPPAETPPAPEPEKENGDGEEKIETAPAYIWEDIALAPRDGSEIMVRYDGADVGTLVRWKHGRRFDGRKWVPGGRWVPAASLEPLSAVEPTHWARPADYVEPMEIEKLAAMEGLLEGDQAA